MYFEMEEKLMSKQTQDRSILDVIQDPEAGRPEDKLRLFIIHYVCTPTMTDVSIETIVSPNPISTPWHPHFSVSVAPVSFKEGIRKVNCF